MAFENRNYYGSPTPIGQNQQYYYQQYQPYTTGQSLPNVQAQISGPPISNQQTNVRPQRTYIPGRIINDEREIIPDEVPMDGSFATFIQSDYKRIYTKKWGGDGLIHRNVYELVEEDGQQSEQTQDPFALIMQRLDNIENSLRSNNKPYYNKKNFKKNNNQNNVKQEVKHE